MAPGEVGVSLPWWCHTLVLWPPGYWGLFLNPTSFWLWKNGQFQRNFRSKLKVLNFSNFTLWNLTFFRVSILTENYSETGRFFLKSQNPLRICRGSCCSNEECLSILISITPAFWVVCCVCSVVLLQSCSTNTDFPLSKGQLISKRPFGVKTFSKNQPNFFQDFYPIL